MFFTANGYVNYIIEMMSSEVLSESLKCNVSLVQGNNNIQGSKFKTNQYCKIRLQIFDIWCKNVRQMCQKSKKKILYIVLFCKLKLIKMAFIKTNIIKTQIALF